MSKREIEAIKIFNDISKRIGKNPLKNLQLALSGYVKLFELFAGVPIKTN